MKRSWAGDTDTRRSHTEYILMMNGGLISWKSRRQDNVSLSTSEAEFVAASQAGQEAIYLCETLTDFGFSQTKATLLYEDNLACVAMSENPVRQKFSRHIDIRKYYVRELVLNGLKLLPLRTHKMVADALTKSLPSPAFVGHRQIMPWWLVIFFRRSTPTLRRWLILSADFERCVFPIFRWIVYIFFLPIYVTSSGFELPRRWIDFFPASSFICFFHIFTILIFWFTQYCLSKIPPLCMGKSDKAPTNKICRRASSEQRPRTRSCHESERLA